MTVDEYVAWALRQQPQGVDVDGAWGPQCVDLVQDYASKLGHPFPLVKGAKDFAGLSIPGWTWVPNTPEAIPSPGVVMVWGVEVGEFGHTGIKDPEPATVWRFESCDQNWYNSSEHGSPPALVPHNYVGVVGWQKPAEGAVSMGIPAFATRQFHGRAFRDTAWYDTPGGSAVAHVTAGTEDDFDARADGDTLWIRGMKDGHSGAWWTPDDDWDTNSYGGTPLALVKEPPVVQPPVVPVVPPADPPQPTGASGLSVIASQLRALAHQLDGK